MALKPTSRATTTAMGMMLSAAVSAFLYHSFRFSKGEGGGELLKKGDL